MAASNQASKHTHGQCGASLVPRPLPQGTRLVWPLRLALNGIASYKGNALPHDMTNQWRWCDVMVTQTVDHFQFHTETKVSWVCPVYKTGAVASFPGHIRGERA